MPNSTMPQRQPKFCLVWLLSEFSYKFVRQWLMLNNFWWLFSVSQKSGKSVVWRQFVDPTTTDEHEQAS